MNDELDHDTALVDTLGAAFATATLTRPVELIMQRGRRLRARRRIARLCGGAVCAVAAAALAVPLLDGGGTTAGQGERLAAWTVTKEPDGLVVVTIKQLRDPGGMQRALRADGIPAAVRFQAAGQMSLTPPLPRECRNTGLSTVADADLQEKILPPPPMIDVHKVGNAIEGTPVYPAGALFIRPSAIPKGIGLNITVDWAPKSWGWSLGLVKASPECTGS